MKTFVQELKTRRVYRVALGYAVAGSAVVQLAGTVLPISVTGPASKPDFKVEVGKIFHRGAQKKK